MNMLQSLIRRKPVRTRHISLFKACGNYLSQPPPTTSTPPLPQSVPAAPLEGELKRYENPCLDLFYNVKIHEPASHLHLTRLLPPAWSHNPLTTLKIIRSLHDPLLEDEDVFFEACYWLHHNHPKTLAYNLPYIMDSAMGHYTTFIQILYRVLELKPVPHIGYNLPHVQKINETMELIEDGLTINLSARQKKLIPEIDRIREMYERDPDFRFLHNRVADLFAEGIKFDIENLLKVQRQQLNHQEVDGILEVTSAADKCDCAPFLLESVAKRIFPERHEYKDDEHYRYRVLKRFRNEVSDPLMKVMDQETYDRDDNVNPSGYIYVPEEPHWPSYYHCYDLTVKYLKKVKESPDKMVADAVNPHHLVDYAGDGDVDQVVELQWKAMVEDLKKKYKDKNMGILSHSLATIVPIYRPINSFDASIQLAMALTILVSELSEVEAWKGKAIHLIPNPGLLSIQGHDLNSKCEFLRNLTRQTKGGRRRTDFKRMFDLILEEAVSWSLKPEEMIKRVFVFTDYYVFERISGGRWEAQDYEVMRSKYKEQGYDMPHIVFWRLGEYLEHVQQYSTDQRGVAIMSGFCQHQTRSAGANLVRMFLENDGDLSPQHVMEAILCGARDGHYSRDDHYSRLAVLD